MTKTVEFSWDTWIGRSAPSRDVVEYEFSSPGGRGISNSRTHDGDRRVFRGDYRRRGAYAGEPGVLTWGDAPLTWGDDNLTWGD